MDQADSISNRDAAADPVPQHVANSDTEQLGLPTAHLKAMNGWSLWLTLAWYAPTNRQRDAKFVSGGDAECLETTIIATALVSISSSLGGFDKSNWVVTAYLITYTSTFH
ncbi:hypothetical protein IF2G_09988 [Cordyceps javanica]|nr:hypothetical protein IF2G_09988 [Cordyceps javanica]